MPFGNFANFADCVRQNPDKDDPDAYCGSIQARTENKLAKAVRAVDPLYQAVRLALESVVAKRDPVKEAGDKKLKEADGVAADGSQDDQAFAVAFGVDNYDKLTKRLLAKSYRRSYQAAGAIVKAIENKQMNFPGNLEDHLKKAHAAIHGREMWDKRYSKVCDLLKKARKLLYDIEQEAELDETQDGGPGKMMGKADPVGKAGTGTYGVGMREGPPKRGPRPGQKPNTFLGKPVSEATPSSRTGMRPAGWGTPAEQRRGGKAKKGLKQNPMGVPGGVAKPGWAQTDQPIPGGKKIKKPVTPQVDPDELGTTPLGMRRDKALRKADKPGPNPVPNRPRGPVRGEIVGPTGWMTSEQTVRGGKPVGKPNVTTYEPGDVMGGPKKPGKAAYKALRKAVTAAVRQARG